MDLWIERLKDETSTERESLLQFTFNDEPGSLEHAFNMMKSTQLWLIYIAVQPVQLFTEHVVTFTKCETLVLHIVYLSRQYSELFPHS